jgi:chorismate mutase
MPDTQTPATAEIAALRAEIDALDDAMHDLLMRRAGVVAQLAASRAKGSGPALRPGREAAILRRLVARHQGPLPRSALVRLWRELLAATTAMQAPVSVAACLDPAALEVLRAHLGLAAPVTLAADAEAALAAARAGTTALAALPPPDAGRWRWWTGLDATRLFVTALLPFAGPGPGEARVMLLSPVPPDPSGEDRTLLRLPGPAAAERLAAAGLAPLSLLQADGLALAELPGFLMQDPRLPALGATPLGAFALPLPA